MRDLGPGWRHGVPTDKPHKISEAYVPWEELPDQQKDKNRNLVRQIPAILRKAGYAMVRGGRPQQAPARMVTIGITGHRMLAETDWVGAGLDQVVQRLDAVYPEPWSVVSALAEGADRLAAHAPSRTGGNPARGRPPAGARRLRDRL